MKHHVDCRCNVRIIVFHKFAVHMKCEDGQKAIFDVG